MILFGKISLLTCHPVDSIMSILMKNPNEILLGIFKYTELKDFCELISVCKHIYQARSSMYMYICILYCTCTSYENGKAVKRCNVRALQLLFFML